jgi:ubiquinone/menaquinone biosynthesis C-methylase UbiE/uncharacterized protein YbaR (Trm112 family)
MKPSLLTHTCCPACKGILTLTDQPAADVPITSGTLVCQGCGASYPILQGIPHLIPGGVLETHKAREVQGWNSLRQQHGAYEHPDLETSFVLPYTGSGTWATVSLMFDMAVHEMAITGHETILDVGAGQGWAARRFAERGCAAIAIDIDADELYGLGRAWAIMQHAGVYYEPVIGDGEHLPFQPDQFDFVFFSAALHHFEHTAAVLRQMYTVLKPGGMLIASGEPAAPLFMHERAMQVEMEEWQAGIVERRPKVSQYMWSLWKTGFRHIQADTRETYHVEPGYLREWITARGKEWQKAARPLNKAFVGAAFGLVRWLPYRLAGQLVIHTVGGNLLLRARKPRRRN